MKTIIKITKQEAIDAWKEQNKHISMGEDTTVEIEETPYVTFTGTSTYRPEDCPICGKKGGATMLHTCLSTC